MTREEQPARFSGRAADYARWRPRYPAELVEVLREDAGLRAKNSVADVGSGTGILSRLLLDHGCTVFAVEPDAEMRRIAENELGSNPAFVSVAGTAEETSLPDSSLDLVTAGQAFHWFDREAARGEFRRILREQGRAALVWYTRDPSVSSFMEAFEAFLLEHGTDYRSVRHDRMSEEGVRSFFASDYRLRTISHLESLDLRGFRGLIRSYSYLPAPGEGGFDRLRSVADDLFRAHEKDGRVTVEYEVEVHVGSP